MSDYDNNMWNDYDHYMHTGENAEYFNGSSYSSNNQNTQRKMKRGIKYFKDTDTQEKEKHGILYWIFFISMLIALAVGEVIFVDFLFDILFF